ncbi:membrane protease subunit, partial [Streptomyces sp. NPDC006333]
AEAAGVMSEQPAALQLRLLQTVVAVAAEKNSTLVLPFPVELLRFLERAQQPAAPAPEPAAPEPAAPEPAAPAPVAPAQGPAPVAVAPAPAPASASASRPEPTAPEPTASDPIAPDPIAPDPAPPAAQQSVREQPPLPGTLLEEGSEGAKSRQD